MTCWQCLPVAKSCIMVCSLLYHVLITLFTRGKVQYIMAFSFISGHYNHPAVYLSSEVLYHSILITASRCYDHDAVYLSGEVLYHDALITVSHHSSHAVYLSGKVLYHSMFGDLGTNDESLLDLLLYATDQLLVLRSCEPLRTCNHAHRNKLAEENQSWKFGHGWPHTWPWKNNKTHYLHKIFY